MTLEKSAEQEEDILCANNNLRNIRDEVALYHSLMTDMLYKPWIALKKNTVREAPVLLEYRF